DHTGPERVVSCLEKIERVWNIEEVPISSSVSRELALIKVPNTSEGSMMADRLISMGTARITDRSDGAIILEVVAESSSVEETLRSIANSAKYEVIRVGPVVISRELER